MLTRRPGASSPEGLWVKSVQTAPVRGVRLQSVAEATAPIVRIRLEIAHLRTQSVKFRAESERFRETIAQNRAEACEIEDQSKKRHPLPGPLHA